MSNQETVKVWDPLVRLFHWSLVLAFVVVYLSGEGEVMGLHEWAGYFIGGLLAFRLLWGFIGPRHARFSDFVVPPAVVLGYLKDVSLLRAKRYLGHNPAGGVMVLALMVVLALTTLTGYIAYQGEGQEQATASISLVSPALADDDHEDDEDENEDGHEGEEGLMHEVHEALANLSLILVLLHIAGVMLSSVLHGENLARAMVTGRKAKEL